jgi:SNF2 family DNA or RNA helicase
MGLGKTAQIIALCAHDDHGILSEKVLIICPCSVLQQWKLEFNKFLRRHSDLVLVYDKTTSKKTFAKNKYIIVSYDNLRLNKPSAIMSCQFKRIIVDEGTYKIYMLIIESSIGNNTARFALKYLQHTVCGILQQRRIKRLHL